ncbi:anti-sigma factor [Salinarimonas rosea]|uniref:anti-sigma factor n=1 Tax=Salinarimonas rosea TaxID=552063 RepID=UPI00048DE30C|nr:anti-sigma factor [Salinarimonas rosea]
MSAGTDMHEGDDDALAGEYVLGTLRGDERAAFEARLAREPALAEAVAAWQERLAPLTEAVAPVAPPADLFARIEARLETEFEESRPATSPPPSPAEVVSLDEVRRLRRALGRWRVAAGGLGALAAALVALAILFPGGFLPPPPEGERYVAVVDRGGDLPALIVQVDVAQGLVRVRAPAAEAPPDRALELWLVAEGDDPRSLGLVRDAADFRIEPAVARASPGATLAVSVEPPGGSPTGAPTGPVVYTGVLIPQ